MALTFGFYNSVEGDRTYDAVQFGQIFDGIITDGVYATYLKAMVVKASENAGEVIIQPGRAWFNHTWSYNDADLVMQAPSPEVLLDRVDALVLDINEEQNVRTNSFMWVQGTPASVNPERPTLIHTTTHNQYPLCYVRRHAETTTIYTEDITNMVGTSECPFVTGVVEGIDLDMWVNQWDAEFHTWENTTKAGFTTWFNGIKGQLDEDAAGHLQNEIDSINEDIIDLIVSISPYYEAGGSGQNCYTGNHVPGDYVLTKWDGLVRVTTNVTAGTVIIEGVGANTNCVKVTLTELIEALRTNIANQLTANNNVMYMDYHDGKYGVNTSANRGADTFIPFKKGLEDAIELGNLGGSFNLSSYRNYQNFTVEKNFFVRITGVSYSGGSTSAGGSEWDGNQYIHGGASAGSISVGPLLAYNASTGVLSTASGGSSYVSVGVYSDHVNASNSTGTSLGISGKVYLVE